ncbi:MAG: TIGR03619 family F420-dependent LLM class oxidoreductase [Actinomycetota bacterium]
MKIRIGYGLGTRNATNDQDRFRRLVDALERNRFDSLWLSERITGDCPDPLVGMSYAMARTEHLKVGMSVMVLPGRNPVVLAKSMASLDRLSGGRLLPAFGLGVADSAEHQAFGVDRKDRGGWFNEALPLMRQLWTEDRVSHEGKRFTIRDVTIRPKPIQDELEVWLGGISPLELKRVGRLADGWLPSFCTPAQVAEARDVIEEVAAEHERAMDPEHYGALIPYRATNSAIPEAMQVVLNKRNPDADPAEIIPTREELEKTIGRFIDVGFSKFVLIPTNEPDDWDTELDELATLVKPLEN